ncbi:MAG: hypothetical protein Cons2KO_15270 [Congregibacter sp.]
MSRSLFITIHLYLSSFFGAAVLLVAISGGLYLIGIKGDVAETVVATVDGGKALAADKSKAAVSAALEKAGVTDFAFDYVKDRGTTLYTRPTSETHYVLKLSGDDIEITRAEPTLQKRMMELHMGHGPTVYKTFQKVFAAGMVFIILSGLWLGLSSDRLRRNTLISAGAGLAIFIALIMG